MCEKFEKIVWQCCHCRLPHAQPLQTPTHGYHETCLLVCDPESYRSMLKELAPGEPVTGNG